jgi:hypothetical protein
MISTAAVKNPPNEIRLRIEILLIIDDNEMRRAKGSIVAGNDRGHAGKV